MKAKQNDSLRELLRQVELPSPHPEFTDEVMRETTSLNSEALVDAHLRTVLQEIRLDEPSLEFTFTVQKEIKKLTQPAESRPIITWGVWVGVFVFVLACVLLSIIPSHDTPADGPVYFTTIANQITMLTTAFREPLLFLEVIVASATLLLIFERMLRRRLHWKSTR